MLRNTRQPPKISMRRRRRRRQLTKLTRKRCRLQALPSRGFTTRWRGCCPGALRQVLTSSTVLPAGSHEGGSEALAETSESPAPLDQITSEYCSKVQTKSLSSHWFPIFAHPDRRSVSSDSPVHDVSRPFPKATPAVQDSIADEQTGQPHFPRWNCFLVKSEDMELNYTTTPTGTDFSEDKWFSWYNENR